ncbi:hypothetical protein KI387_034468, partial [Taxus chinensis]
EHLYSDGSQGNPPLLDWGTRLRIALDAAKGLEYFHERVTPPVIHHDFKANNILLDEHFKAKVSDFGLAKLGSDKLNGEISTRTIVHQLQDLWQVRNLSAKYIMKCDDDNFVRVDAVLKEVKKLSHGQDVYIGNLNYYHKPLRMGKWGVTYEEWPEEDYPPYANVPGYIISNNIGNSIVSQHNNKTLRLFKMEDVSMGMWVEKFNASTPVQYSYDWKFCQFGCVEDYITTHYQSPRQMFYMWDKLSKGNDQCYNMRKKDFVARSL